MKKSLYIFAALAASFAVCCAPDNIEKPEEPGDEPGGEKEVLDTTMLHSLGLDDVHLQAYNRLPAEYFKPSKHKTVYYPILVDRAKGTVSTADKMAWKPEKTRILYNMCNFLPDTTAESYKKLLDEYGGNKTMPRQEVTGRFYTKKIDGRWWIIDPLGYPRYERAVTSFRRGGSARCDAAWAQRFGSNEAWLRITSQELWSKGIHGTGAFCSNTYNIIQDHNAAHPETRLSLSPSVGFIGTFKSHMKYDYPKSASGDDSDKLIGLVFYPGWEEFCDWYAPQVYAQFKDDPNVLGVFSDNEIDFTTLNGANPRILERFLKILDDNDPAKKAALKFLADKGYDDKYELDDWDNAEFAGIVAEQYYKYVSAAIKKFDPGMMYLGSRLNGQPMYLEGVIKAAGKYVDIVGMNYYGRWSPEITTKISQWEKWMDKPFMVTEFYTKGMDSDLPNTSGAGFAVRTQYDRAYAYQNFTLGLLECRNCVGWQWFKYQDDDFPDNGNAPCNKGLYGNDYRMYPYLGQFMKDVNYNVYKLIEFFDSQE